MLLLTRTDPLNASPIHLKTERQLSSCVGRQNVKAESSNALSTAFIPARVFGTYFLKATISGIGALKLADGTNFEENHESGSGDFMASDSLSSEAEGRGVDTTEGERRTLKCCDAFIETLVKIGDGFKLGGEGLKLGGEGVKLGGEGVKLGGEGVKLGGEGVKQGGEGLKMAGEGFSKGFKDIGCGAKVLSWSLSAWLANKIAVDWGLNDMLRSRDQKTPARQ